MGLELTTDMYPPITSQTGYPLRHAGGYKARPQITGLKLENK